MSIKMKDIMDYDAKRQKIVNRKYRTEMIISVVREIRGLDIFNPCLPVLKG
jgi:hypothetical protein